MMSADCGFGTTKVVTGKLALLAPAGTVMLGCTVAAAGSSLDSATVKPPAGAAAVSRTVPVTGVPPRTSVGLTVTAVSAAGADEGGGDDVGGGFPCFAPALPARASRATRATRATAKGFMRRLSAWRQRAGSGPRS